MMNFHLILATSLPGRRDAVSSAPLWTLSKQTRIAEAGLSQVGITPFLTILAAVLNGGKRPRL